jgi:uncharacterized protein (UPF0276 family)
MGLGLSSNAQRSDVPNPYEVLDEMPGAFDFVEYSAPLDVDEARTDASLFAQMLKRRADVPLLYHPVHVNLYGPVVESAERLALLAKHVSAVGSPWVSNDVAWWHCEGAPLPGYLYLTPPLNAQGLENAIAHAQTVAAAAPVPLLLENPVVMTARGDWHVLDFMERLSTATGCGLLLDVGHLFSHQLARGRGLMHGLDAFAFERVVELHIAGGVVTSRGGRAVYVDDHPQPIRDEVWALLEAVLPKCTGLKALTYEGDGHPKPVAKATLRRLRALMPATHHHAEAPRPGPPAHLDASGLASAWQVFTEVHRAHCPDDPEGATAELDYRLAVIAQTLDAAVPLTRLAIAASRDALTRFVATDEVRDWFEHGNREFADVFVAWSMRALREPALRRAEALVSLEAWARHTARRLTHGASMPAVFPVCLTDALHAAKALPRHLGARAAWSAFGFESTGLEGLLQAAARATPGPSAVTLTRVGARIEINEPVT